MSFSRRSLFKGAVGAAGLLLIPEPVIATPEPLQRFWPGWRPEHGRGGINAFIQSNLRDPNAAPLTQAEIVQELEALWREMSKPQPWDLLYVETDRDAQRGDLGIWTGVAFVPFTEMNPVGTRPGEPSLHYTPGGITIVTPQQIAEWTR